MFLARLVENPSNCLHYTKHQMCSGVRGNFASIPILLGLMDDASMFVVALRAGPWYLERLEARAHEFLLIQMKLEFARQHGWIFGAAPCVKPAPGSLCPLLALRELPRAALK